MLFKIIGCILVSAATISHAVCAIGGTGGADLTRNYLNAYNNSCAFGAAHVTALRGYQVLLVPGYLSGLYPENFMDQMRWLATVGVEHKKVAITSGDSVDINGAIIATAIRTSTKPVILITHSKGSLDALQALLSEPLLRGKVKGWISLQGAFFGTPVADKLFDGSVLNPLFSIAILGFFGGTRESAHSLTTGASHAYYKKHAPAISQLLQEVPAVAFASAIDTASGTQPSPPLEIPFEIMTREGIRSDGLIPLEAAVLPGMDFIKVSSVDHIAPVMRARQHFNRVRMTQALLLALRSPLHGLPHDANCKAQR